MSREEDAGLDVWLDRVRSEYWERLSEVADEGDTPGVTHVLFEVGGRRFALDASLCKGVVRRPRTTRLPGVPDHSLGVAGIRGEVISVVDPGRFLALLEPRPPEDGYLLVVADEKLKAALWVDRVADVVSVTSDQIIGAEAPWRGIPDGVLVGQWGDPERPVFLLDGRVLLSASATGGARQS